MDFDDPDEDMLGEVPPFPLVVERGLTSVDPIPASSYGFQGLYLHSQRCPCGARFRAEAWRRLVGGGSTEPALSTGAVVLEAVPATCQGCGRVRWFWFDITGFHGDPAAAVRFTELRHLFEDALAAVARDDFDGAAVRFREVVDREPWLGVAHFHLGMIASRQERWDDAREHLLEAVGLMPLDAGVRHGLAELWLHLDEDDRASRDAWMAMLLEAVVEAQDEDLPSGPPADSIGEA